MATHVTPQIPSRLIMHSSTVNWDCTTYAAVFAAEIPVSAFTISSLLVNTRFDAQDDERE